MSGLDLSFLNDPANRLPDELKLRRAPIPRGERSDLPSPYFMGDITPFVNVASRETHEITSRSQLRAFERSSGMRQVGNDFQSGSIVAEHEAKAAEWKRHAETTDHGWIDPDL